MKSIFSKLIKSSLFNHALRLAIVLVGLSYSAAAAADKYYSQMTVSVSTESTGSGKVYVSRKSTIGKYTDPTDDSYQATSTAQVNGSTLDEHKYMLWAKADEGSYFDGWTTDCNSEEPTNTNNPTEITYQNNSTNENQPSPYYYYAIFNLCAVYRDYAQATAIMIDENNMPIYVGDLTNPSSIVFTQGGGFVNIGTAANNETLVTVDNGTKFGVKDQASWNYTFYATANTATTTEAPDGYEFVGWYTQSTLLQQMKDNQGKLDVEKPTSANRTYTTQNFTTTNTDKTKAPIGGEPMFAVFRKVLVYWHTGPSVAVAGNEPDGGLVYVDNGTAGTVSGVANDAWKKEIIASEDINSLISQKTNPAYTYTYYAKPNDKYAFKGWATSQYGVPTLGADPANPDKDYAYEFTMRIENTKQENPYYTPTLYAVFESFYYTCPPAMVATNSKGLGKVAVSLTEIASPTYSDEVAAGALQQVAANGNDHAYDVYYYAKAEAGAEFAGWSTTADGLNIIAGSNDPDATYYKPSPAPTTQAKNRNYPHVEAPLYAVFRSDIDIRQQDRMIVYVDDEGNGNINDAKVLIDFQKGKTLQAQLTGADASYFTLSNRSGSKNGSSITFDATQGLIELVVAYQGDLNQAKDKKANIILTATYDDGTKVNRPVTIVVEEAPIVTFLPTDGKGAYSISMTNGSGINYTMSATTKENIKVAVTHESMCNIELKLDPTVSKEGYRFFGWQMIDGDAVTYLSHEQLCNYQFTRPVKVRAEFIPTNWAIFYIKNDPSNMRYHDLQKALDDASVLKQRTSVDQEVVLYDKDHTGAAITESFLRKGVYTVYAGITLNIPGDTAHSFHTALTDPALWYSKNASKNISEHYIKLNVEDGTNFTISGNLSVYGIPHINGQKWVGRPYRYGWLEMGENCHIDVKNGANLYAFGYITGPMSATITVKNGAAVKEMFQILDWHGGTETLSYLNLFGVISGSIAADQKVFPTSQFYVQNVEIPMTLEYGAKESLTAGVDVGDLQVVEAPFIGVNDGLFRMVSGTSLTKYYDKFLDKQVYIVNGDGQSEVKLGDITLKDVPLGAGDLSVGNKDIPSSAFVLAMPHNMDIRMYNAKVTMLYDMAFLPNSSLYVDKTSVLTINGTSSQVAKMYVYDQIQNGNYFGTGNKAVIPVGYRPGGLLLTREAAMLEDAKIVIDGQIVCGTYGKLYTTNTTNESVECANITSNGGGKVSFTSVDASQGKTYQRKMGEWVEIPTTTARLRNQNGTYVAPEAATYTYVNGAWTTGEQTATPQPQDEVSYVPTFKADDYTTSTYVGKPSTGTLTNVATANTNVEWKSVNWEYVILGEHADQFTFAWGTKPNGTVTFTPTSEGTKKATLRIKATYNKNMTIGTANVTVAYTYIKDIQLTGNAIYLTENTLTFADLSTIYFGQEISLLQGGNNTNNVQITTNNTAVATTNTDVAWNDATITAKAVGEVTITVKQEADLTNNIAATSLTKKVKVSERVVWNWDVLYFGDIYRNPITTLDGSTDWTLVESKDTSNIIDFNKNELTATIQDQIAGEYGAEFTFTQGSEKKLFKTVVIPNPQHLRVDVNNETVFRAVTLSANENVEFAKPFVKFTSTDQNISQWKMYFIGVPDKIHFIPNGSNTWQIEESSNGVNWTTSFPWKYLTTNQPFEMSLLPSTRYVRISYGAGNASETGKNVGTLNELYITELVDVNADVKKLYMPVEEILPSTIPATYKSVTKEVVLTYANTGGLNVGTSDPKVFQLRKSNTSDTPSDVLQIAQTTEDNPFGIIGIEVISSATTEMQGYLNVYEGATLVLQIPIQTYLFPQELPIKLATDKPDGGDRYYFVTTHTHNTEWDGTNGVRTITLHNAVSDAAPYLTFAFKGNPTYISFDYSTSAKGTWVIEESVDGKSWTTTMPNTDAGDKMENGKLKRTLKFASQFVRVIYESAYAEKVNIKNLTIVGDASVIVNPATLELDYDIPELVTASAINLKRMVITSDNPNFTVTHNANTGEYKQSFELNNTNYTFLDGSQMGDISLYVKWLGTDAVEQATLTITNPDDNNKVLATVELIGVKSTLVVDENGEIGLHTGVPEDYTLKGKFEGTTHRPINLNAAFSPSGEALFDYVVVYGETTTNDGSTSISTPTTIVGSNAKTPCYIYQREETAYKFMKQVENTNSKDKTWYVESQGDMDAVQIPEGKNAISMYITGFCPYASTGYTKAEEGVWYFRADAGQTVDIYLEDCYLYSRAKTIDGHYFIDRYDGYSFIEPVACGSGAVLVFACNTQANVGNSMKVNIHTLDSNLLKSHYGCFLQSIAGRAYQSSSPIQNRILEETYFRASQTEITFTDEWPKSKNSITEHRTNGFISLQKQVNNAPSIDMGTQNSIVNFDGGQVELENAQIVSTNYKSSLAICPRSGEFAGFFLAYGMATDHTGGTVNFKDGTTTVRPMYVDPNYAESYLLDKDANGNTIKDSRGWLRTSCLRTPENTFVTGGSHCMMRACPTPTSQGGAPKDKAGADGKLLGLYKYTKTDTTGEKYGWAEGQNGLVVPTTGMVPNDYSVKSVTPNTNGTTDANDDYLNFWFDPNFEPSVKPEINKEISFWKTCMTEIEAEYAGEGGSVGGDTEVDFTDEVQTEIIKYLLYCKIDEYILDVIGGENYMATVKNPTPEGDSYLPIHPSKVGIETQHFINTANTYQVENKLYYITTATADVWQVFTAPFDVEKVYIMETYPENELRAMENNYSRTAIMQEQAKHNADFAAFFAVTIALKQEKNFDQIYQEYMQWAQMKDEELGLNDNSAYTPRGKRALVPFDGTDWNADFYLNEDSAPWEIKTVTETVDGKTETSYAFTTSWTYPNTEDNILMHQGKTYSMLFPYCTGCGDNISDRQYWDYWSGKFLIFESTDGPHKAIHGSSIFNSETKDNVFSKAPEKSNKAQLSGNSSFAAMTIDNNSPEMFTYTADLGHSSFDLLEIGVDQMGNSETVNILPTESFLLTNFEVEGTNLLPSRILRTGEIIYDSANNSGTTDGGHMPTVGGGNDMFITAINGGVNIAVAVPQMVRVLSSTGAVIYSGMVQASVDVTLPTNGIYVISGENEVQKILF